MGHLKIEAAGWTLAKMCSWKKIKTQRKFLKSVMVATSNSIKMVFCKNTSLWTFMKVLTMRQSACTCTADVASILARTPSFTSLRQFSQIHSKHRDTLLGYLTACCLWIRLTLPNRLTLKICQRSKSSWTVYSAARVPTIKRKE